MVEELGKTGAISNQKFNQKGMQLSQLKENKQVYEFFKNAGLSDSNYVYASDIQNIFDKFDENKNGKLSVKEARELGFEGSRKEVKDAVKVLNQILETQINDGQEVYPAKVDDNTTDYYYPDGKLKYRAQTVATKDGNVEKFTFYRDGDRNKVATYAEKSDDIGYILENNEAGLPEKETLSIQGNVTVTNYEYDDENNLQRQTIDAQGVKTVTDFDANRRPVKIVETNTGSELSSIIINQYDDENGTLTQNVKNNPVDLKEGIAETVSTYSIDEESGKTDELLYRKEVGIDGNVKEFKQVAPDEIEEKRDGYTIRTKWHENGKTSTVQDGNETHVIEYDNDGNTYVYVKNGETFRSTANRLLGKDATDEEINNFRELNKDLIKKFGKDKVEAFHVGEKIRVPGELEYNEANKANLTVDPEAEIKGWQKAIGSMAAPTAPKDKDVKGEEETPAAPTAPKDKDVKGEEETPAAPTTPKDKDVKGEEETPAAPTTPKDKDVKGEEETPAAPTAPKDKDVKGEQETPAAPTAPKDKDVKGEEETPAAPTAPKDKDVKGEKETPAAPTAPKDKDVKGEEETPATPTAPKDKDVKGEEETPAAPTTPKDKDVKGKEETPAVSATPKEPTGKVINDEDKKNAGDVQGSVDVKDPKVNTLTKTKKQLDEQGIKYTVNGNKLTYKDSQGRNVIMTYKNGIKTHEAAYPSDAVNTEGEQLVSRRYYDKEYKNGVIYMEKEYYDTNPRKIAVQRGYRDGVIFREVKCYSEEQKNRIMSERLKNGEKFDTANFIRQPLISERSEFVNGKKVKTITYRDGDLNKIDTLQTYRDGYTTTTVYRDGDTTKVMSIAKTYPNNAYVVLKQFKDNNLDQVAELREDMISHQTFKPQYDAKGKITGYEKDAGTTFDAQGNLKSCKLADDLYKQLRWYSDNDITEEMLSKIKEDNVVDVLEGFQRLSPKEPLFEYVNNEWGFGLGREYMDPVLKKLLKVGNEFGIKNPKLQSLAGNNPGYKKSDFTDEEIKLLNEQVPQVVTALRNKYKAIIKENM